MTTNPHEALARLQKATKLADFLTAQCSSGNGAAGLLADVIGRIEFDDKWWMDLAYVAGTRSVSADTKRLVLETLRARARGAK